MVLQDTLVMGADYFESSEERLVLRERGGIPIGVGKGTTVKGAILDKNVRIGSGVTIVNKDRVEEADRPELQFLHPQRDRGGGEERHHRRRHSDLRPWSDGPWASTC